MNLQGTHIISATQFTDTDTLSSLFYLALKMEEHEKTHTLQKTLTGKITASLFYEPSTRTRFSF